MAVCAARVRGGRDVKAGRDFHDDNEVPLGGILAKFRTALRAEIGAARRHESGSAIPLANGRRIAQLGSRYQYVFDIENVTALCKALGLLRMGHLVNGVRQGKAVLYTTDKANLKALASAQAQARASRAQVARDVPHLSSLAKNGVRKAGRAEARKPLTTRELRIRRLRFLRICSAPKTGLKTRPKGRPTWPKSSPPGTTCPKP